MSNYSLNAKIGFVGFVVRETKRDKYNVSNN